MELMKLKIISSPSSLGLPENIDEIKKLYIKSEVTDQDAFKYQNLQRLDLRNTIDNFFNNDQH